MKNAGFLIFSDIHGNFNDAYKVLSRQIKAPDAVLFLGDGARDVSLLRSNFPQVSFVGVRGNCDFFGADDLPDERVEELCGLRVLMLHGHTRGAKSGLGSIIKAALEADADAVLFGHTHTPVDICYLPEELCAISDRDRPLWLFNPGAMRNGEFGTLSVRDGVPLFSHGNI
jgi:putative phosphoesterase